MVTVGGGASNTPPIVTQRIDWLEITLPANARNMPDMYPPGWSEKRVECKPMNGYKIAARYPDGRIEMYHPGQTAMGYHVVMSSKTLDALGDGTEIIKHFGLIGAKITRLDCALDVFDYPLDFDEMWSECQAREFVCNVRTPPLRTHDTAYGDTIYFGRMKSSALTRIYNKAAEQGVDKMWTRVETMMRHSRAHNAARKIAAGVEPAALIAGHVKFKRLAWWTDVMTIKAEKTRLDRPNADKRREWLLRSVAPTLAKEIALHGMDVWAQFYDAVWQSPELRRMTETEHMSD